MPISFANSFKYKTVVTVFFSNENAVQFTGANKPLCAVPVYSSNRLTSNSQMHNDSGFVLNLCMQHHPSNAWNKNRI